MVFFVLGNLSFKKVVLNGKKLLADIPATPVHYGRTPPPLYVPEHLVVHKDTHQAHVMIGSRDIMHTMTSARTLPAEQCLGWPGHE